LPPDAVAIRPFWPKVASAGALTLTVAWAALLIVKERTTGAAGL
jgi:hypothetical protein